MLRKNLFIIFTGIDNAGKSSQINILKSSFLSNGKKVYTFWARGGYTPNFEILKFLMRKIFSNKNTESRNNKIRKRIFKNQFLSKLWINIAILDLIYYWCIVLRLKLIFGYQVICDRYYEDTFLDFKINFPNINFEKLPLWKLLFLLKPKPDFSFLLYVDVEESLNRSKLKNEPFPNNKDELLTRLSYYLSNSFFPNNNYIKIDTKKDIKEVSELILNKISIL